VDDSKEAAYAMGILSWRLQAYLYESSLRTTTGAVKPLQFHLSFQSRVGPVKWIGPYTDFKIRELAQEKKVKSCAGVLLGWFAL
jgi:protoheme ferro-lyase